MTEEVVLAAKKGETTTALAWLDGGVDATFEYTFGGGSRMSGTTLLMVAMAHGRGALAEALLRRGAMSRCRPAMAVPR